MSRVKAEVLDIYREAGWWVDDTVSDSVARNALARPDAPAYSVGDMRLSWRDFDRAADSLAADLVAAGAEPGDRVAFCLADTGDLHTCFVAAERAGVTIVGFSARAGRREIRHLLGTHRHRAPDRDGEHCGRHRPVAPIRAGNLMGFVTPMGEIGALWERGFCCSCGTPDILPVEREAPFLPVNPAPTFSATDISHQ